ncbi:MAG: hypothetical protein J0I06_01580 [Planctomycetes bacterium]|nr:hypothetical protein [Planctomycetota bacterium]
MSTTFNFEELDEATHDYLVAVRDAQGLGSPGVFVSTSDSLPGCGCIAGPILVVVTLALTLTTWAGIIYDDPVGVALLQTGGLLLGGWLLVAGFRGSKGSNKIAGTWVYVDPLHLYEAYREQVTVTSIEDVVEAHFTHNYNNGAYQNSVVNIAMGGNRVSTVTINNEARAEQMVVYLNYLAWARGPDGGERAKLPAATLGGLAKYVAKNDHEPLDAESSINLNLIELDITEVPEEPARTGRAAPAVLPYLLMIAFAAVCFVVMAFVVNPPLRDDAIFDAVMKEPSVEPRFLRAYLVDSRNKLHRDEVTRRLSRFYDQPIEHVRQRGGNKELRDGMAAILESVRTADQPVVSIRVTEKGTPAGKEGSKGAREGELRTQFVNGVNSVFSQQPWGQPVQPPPGMTFKETPPPVGQQLLAFTEAPEDAKKAHFEITYTVTPGDFGVYQIAVEVEIRTNVDDANPTARGVLTVPGTFSATDFDNSQTMFGKVRDELVRAMVGSG